MKNIIDTATSNGSFKTLLKAIQAADLTATLTGPGPFTLFAPDDQAFTKLPQGALDALLADIPRLKNVLNYHVVPGKVMSSEISKLTSAKTVQGQEVIIATPGGVRINDSKVTRTDLVCENGVIHVIDAVLNVPAAASTTN